MPLTETVYLTSLFLALSLKWTASVGLLWQSSGETWPPNTGGADLIPGQEAKIPQASQPKKKKPKMD